MGGASETPPSGSRRRRYCPHADADGHMCGQCRSARTRKLWFWSGGLAAAAVVLAALVAWTGHRLTEYVEEDRAYRDARPCPATEATQRDCLRDVPVVVRAVIDVDGRSPRHALHVTGEGFSYRSVEVSGSGPMIKHVGKGDTVLLTLWRDRVVELRAGSYVETTRDTPHDDAAAAVTVIGAGTPLVPALFRFGWWLPRNRRAVVDNELVPALDAWRPTDVGLVAAAAATLVARLIAPELGVGPGLAAQAVTAAVAGSLAFVVGFHVTPRFKSRSGHKLSPRT